MKILSFPRLMLVFLTLNFLAGTAFSQSSPQTYFFPLATHHTSSDNAVSLQVLPNSLGQTGSFAPMAIPSSTCSGGGTLAGWSFQKMVGLQFNNQGFIQNEWTISFRYHVTQMNVLNTPYVRLFSHRHPLDYGFYIDPNPGFFGFGAQQNVYYYHGAGFGNSGNLGPSNSINTTDIFTLTFTRTTGGLIRYYLDGVLQASFSDPSNAYLTTTTDDRIVFFQDTLNPSGLYPNEAEAGWVSEMYISNIVWADSLIQDRGQPCPTLLPAYEVGLHAEVQDEEVELSWLAIGEVATIQSWQVERSENGASFETVATLEAGQTDWRTSPLRNGQYCYRIRAIQADGFSQLSHQVELEINHHPIRLFPNPAAEQTTLLLANRPTEQGVRYKLLNLQGKLVRQGHTTELATTISLSMLPAGLYHLILQHPEGNQTRLSLWKKSA